MLTPMVSVQSQRLVEKLWLLLNENPVARLDQLALLIFIRIVSNHQDHLGLTSRFSLLKRHDQFDKLDQLWHSLITARHQPERLRVEFNQTVALLRTNLDPAHPFVATLDPGSMPVFDPDATGLLLEALDQTPLGSLPAQRDQQEEIIEGLLGKLWQTPLGGDYYSPQRVVDAMAELARPNPGDRVCDPAAGLGGCLIATLRQLGEDLPKGQQFTGYDVNTAMVRIATVRFMLHGVMAPNLKFENSFDAFEHESLRQASFDVVLCCPPYGNLAYNNDRSYSWMRQSSNRLEHIFSQLSIDLLCAGGRGVLHIPESLLFSVRAEAGGLRELLVEHNQVHAVISLPAGYLRPYTQIRTAILLFTRGGVTDEVFLYRVSAEDVAQETARVRGTTLDSLATAIAAYRAWADRTPQDFDPAVRLEIEQSSCSANRTKIAALDYDLSPSRHLPVPLGQQVQESPEQLLSDLLSTQEQLTSRLRELQKSLTKLGG